MRIRAAIAVCGLCLFACGSEGDMANPEPGDPDDPGQPGKSGPGDHNGQTGSPGAVECSEARECAQTAEAVLASLEKPSNYSHTFSAAACEQTGVIAGDQSASGTACHCKVKDSDGAVMIGPVGVGCFVLGRGGVCLWDDTEFDGCAVHEPGACDDVCDELQARLAADAAREFETRLVHASCDEMSCHSVVEIDGRCYADGSYQVGRDYDCALGVEQILILEAEGREPPQMTEVPPSTTPYLAGTDGYVELAVNTGFAGTAKLFTLFGAWAQFFVTRGEGVAHGTVVDPLDGIDDCGVIERSSFGSDGFDHFIDIGELTLSDRGTQFAFELTPNSHGAPNPFYSYMLDLSLLEVAPRYGGSYAITGGGGEFGDAIEISDVRLPEALSIHELETHARVERAALRLTWTGHGTAPLRVRLSVMPKLADSGVPYDIECLLEDDGEFEVPAAVLERAPEGIVTADFRREKRVLVDAGEKTIVSNAAVIVSHRFALGARCDRADVMAACRSSAERMRAEYTACDVEPPALADLCPDYLAESCVGCTEYFECLADRLSCGDLGLMSSIGCACP